MRFWAGLLCLCLAGPLEARWLRAESPNFVVYSEEAEETLRDQVNRLEEFDRLLRMLTRTGASPSPNKLHIYLVRGRLALGLVRDVGDASGFYVASSEGIAAFVDRRAAIRAFDLNDDVLFHEYTHHFMLQYHPSAYPKWYVEGFAEYMMTARILPDRIVFGGHHEGRAFWLMDRDSWLPVERILNGDIQPGSEREVSLFYAQSWLLTHFVLSDVARRAALGRFIDATSGWQEPVEAFASAFEMDMPALERALRAHSRNYNRFILDRVAGPAVPMAVTPLGEAADDLLLLDAALKIGAASDRQHLLLDQIRRLSRDVRTPFAQRVRARAEILYGDGGVGEALVDSLLTGAPNDPELLYLKGMRQLVAGRADPASRAQRFREAQSWFARARRADPNHYPSLVRHAESISGAPEGASENPLDLLLQASRLAPQVAEIRISAAAMLLVRGEFDGVERLLVNIARNAHDADSIAVVSALRALAQARRQPDEQEIADLFRRSEAPN